MGSSETKRNNPPKTEASKILRLDPKMATTFTKDPYAISSKTSCLLYFSFFLGTSNKVVGSIIWMFARPYSHRGSNRPHLSWPKCLV
jgi:hypothetical protein